VPSPHKPGSSLHPQYPKAVMLVLTDDDNLKRQC